MKNFKVIVVAIAAAVFFVMAHSGAHAASAAPDGRYIVVAKSDSDYTKLRDEIKQLGVKIISEMSTIDTLVVLAPGDLRNKINASMHVQGIASDGIRTLFPPGRENEFYNPGEGLVSGGNPPVTISPDPAFSLSGLMWNINRINAPAVWNKTLGSPSVLVGISDTGLDYTHAELVSQVADVVDFTVTEDPPICKTYYGFGDDILAFIFQAPSSTLDFNGHGSWIGGNIAAALDGSGINGIAPGVKLVALKISQWCGSAYDSTIINSFLYAADHGIDIVSISFGGYLDFRDSQQLLIYVQYMKAVQYAKSRGTVIVAAAGNEHVRIGPGGMVMSHGSLTNPGDRVADLFGQFEVPGGVPGIIDVASTGNIVNESSSSCPADSLLAASHQWCKPLSDPHQPFGTGRQNQLAYYSNYGPRIDFAAPGGARKFNLPSADRGGTEGWPWTGQDSIEGGTSVSDGYNAWQDFSITSNWAIEIPCIYFSGLPEFTDDQCYSTIQGTSMATPHVSGALALLASRNSYLRHHPDALVNLLKSSGTRQCVGNKTPALSTSDLSGGDLTGGACPGGYCHLGGAAIPDTEACGKGLVDLRNIR